MHRSGKVMCWQDRTRAEKSNTAGKGRVYGRMGKERFGKAEKNKYAGKVKLRVRQGKVRVGRAGKGKRWEWTGHSMGQSGQEAPRVL